MDAADLVGLAWQDPLDHQSVVGQPFDLFANAEGQGMGVGGVDLVLVQSHVLLEQRLR